MILKDFYDVVKRRLAAADNASAALDARLLICHVLNISHEEFIVQTDRVLSPNKIEKIEELVTQRIARKPVAKILGQKEFYGRIFLTSENTLDPRPDSETLIDAVLKNIDDKNKPLRILDLGTGTGCLLLTLLSELPQATGIGVDQSDAALALARENAVRLEVLMIADFIQGNWFEHVIGQFDIIISNPPYIPTADIATLSMDVQDYDPTPALDGGADGLAAYRAITDQAANYLKKGGLIAFEVGQGQADDVSNLLKNKGFSNIMGFKDLAGISRVVLGKYL
jgi:release factor glutamine methyltransferase